MRAEIGEIMLRETKNSCSCGWGKSRSDSYRDLLYEYTPLRILGTPISKVVERIQSISYDGNRQYHASTSRYDKDYYHEPAKYIATLAEKLEKAKRRVSLCLDCVQGSGETESCRFEHEEFYYRFNWAALDWEEVMLPRWIGICSLILVSHIAVVKGWRV